MEGWLYGLFTLLGVLAGGLFTYLSMEKQLKQQGEIDSRQWRRNVRSEPLLQMRAELAGMGAKLHPLIFWITEYTQKSVNELELGSAMEEMGKSINDAKAYLTNSNPLVTLFAQHDKHIVGKVKEIAEDYQTCLWFATSGLQKTEEFEKALNALKQIGSKIVEVQELINQRLEEL